jgi:hypothetical protein
MSIFLSSKNKQNYLIEQLTSTSIQECNLTIFSCYITKNSIIKLVDKLKTIKQLTSVQLFCDRKQASKLTVSDYHEIEKQVDLRFVNVESGYLFHSKAYCLSNTQEKKGILCISSANLTGAGITEENGNNEIFIETQDWNDIAEFLKEANELKTSNYREAFNFSEESSDFKYVLLNCGKFMHEWNEDLESAFKIVYQLTELGKEKVKSTEFKKQSLTPDAKTVSRNYFELKALKDFIKQANSTKKIEGFNQKIRKNYGISTNLGYWIPNPIVNYIEDDISSKCEEFKKFARTELYQQLNVAVAEIHENLIFLLQKNGESYIKKIPKAPQNKEISRDDFLILDEDSQKQYLFDVLKAKIDKLFKLGDAYASDIRIIRILNRFTFNNIPYIFENIEEINNLYDSLTETVISQQSNVAKRAVKKAAKFLNVDCFYNFIYYIKCSNCDNFYFIRIQEHGDVQSHQEAIKCSEKILVFSRSYEEAAELKFHDLHRLVNDFNLLSFCEVYKRWKDSLEQHKCLVKVNSLEDETF